MAIVLYQGLQSCTIDPITLRLKLVAAPSPCSSNISSLQKPHFNKTSNNVSNENHQFPSNPEMGKPNSCSFWEALSNNPREISTIEKLQEKQTHVHHMKLSEKSLQLCTENLGCETGSDIITSETNVISTLSYTGKSSAREEEETEMNHVKKTTSRSLSFPPPLTTIRDNAFKVRSHREDGHLVVEAVKSPSRFSCFKVERSQGRLKLSIFKAKGDFETREKQGCEENEEVKPGNETRGVVGEFEEIDCYDHEEDDEESEGKMMDGGEGEVEMEMIQRLKLIRCKDGNQHENNGLLNWKPCWVALASIT